MATTTYTPSMLRGAGTRGIPEVPGASSFTNTYSMAFDGIDDKITISGCTTHSADISVSFWMKAPAQGTTNIFGGGGIFQYFGSLNTGGALYIYDTGGSPAWKGVVGGAFDDTWHHIVVTRDSGTNTIKGYKDSVLDTTTVFSNAFLNNIICTIGSYSTVRFYEGLLDEVSLYNSILNQTQINTLYNSGTPDDLTSLNPIGWWRMGDDATWDGSKWDLIDQGSGGNNATSAGMVEADRETNTP